jgi:hypothetical protein
MKTKSLNVYIFFLLKGGGFALAGGFEVKKQKLDRVKNIIKLFSV